MTALWIILGIIAFIIIAIYILLHISVHCYVDASNKGVKLLVTYLGIKLWQFDSDDPEQKETSSEDANDAVEDKPDPVIELSELTEITEAPEASVPDEEASEVPSEGEDISSGKLDGIKAKIEEYKPFIPVAKKGLQKLIKLIRFYDLELYLTLGDTDAYKASLNFGRVNTLVYSVIGLLCTAFTVKIKRTDINCVFDKKIFDAHFKTVVKVRPSAVVCLLIYLGINYLKITRKNKNKSSEKELNNNE